MACKESQAGDEIDRLLHAVLAELDPVIQGLAVLGAGEEKVTKDSAAMLSRPELDAQLDQLQRLLEESDVDATELLASLQNKWAGDSMARALQAVAAALEHYDFDAALTLLRRVRGA